MPDAWFWNIAPNVWFQNIVPDARQAPARRNISKIGKLRLRKILNVAPDAWFWNIAPEVWFQNIAPEACQAPARRPLKFQKAVTQTLLGVLAPLHFEYRPENKVYRFFWSWV